MLKGCLGPPANEKAGPHVGPTPIQDFGQLLPVGDVFPIQSLNGGAGNDEAIEFVGIYFIPGLIKGQKVIFARILGLVGVGREKGDVDLEWGVPE